MVSAGGFPKEENLEDLLAKFPDLLCKEGEPRLAFVDRQVNLPKAGKLDLLFVDEEGLPESEDKSGAIGGTEPYPELESAFAAYNASAPQDLQAVGKAINYRMIHLGPWEGRAHYIFFQNRTWIGVRLGGERSLADLLAPLEGKPLADGQGKLVWDPAWHSGEGRLFSQFPVATPANTIAQAMRDLLSMTRAIVTEKLLALSAKQQAAGN
jgi:hypothetical protein